MATSEHLNELAIMMEPLQFVTADAPGVLRLINEKIKLLEREGRPVTVVSAVGELRIGKSYLLTRILRASLPPGMHAISQLRAVFLNWMVVVRTGNRALNY